MKWPLARFSATHTLSVREAVSAGTVKLKPVPFVLTLAGAPPLCCKPVLTPLAVGGVSPSDHENVNGCGPNCPSPRSGIGTGAVLMFVRLLIRPPPALLTSGLSELLVPPFA